MRAALHISFLVVFVLLAVQRYASYAQERIVPITEIEVVSRRPIKEIGLQQTKLDSMVLKENVSLTMADVLTFNSPVFIKNAGRATLSTLSFRGTSPSHTQVTWNGMRITSPMLGVTDFSMIPSHFIDRATLLAGPSSVGDVGGGLGGAVRLATAPSDTRGVRLDYVQGVGSFLTFDEYLRVCYGSERWQLSTRVAYSSSRNDFKYRNRDKKENIYDDAMNIIGQYYPVERNRSGAFGDLHIMQEAYYRTSKGDRLGLAAWYVNSDRELSLLTADYGTDTDFENRQREQTLRAVLSWEHRRSTWQMQAKAGYLYTWLAYDYRRDAGSGTMLPMTRSRSNINTLFANVDGEWHLSPAWLLSANVAMHQHFVRSEDKSIILQDGDRAIVGYDKARVELSAVVKAAWRPVERFGMALVVREEMSGTKFSLPIPALFVDAVLSKRGNVVLKGSVSRNLRFPTLNDLYFLPGGNPDLREERGWTYDVELSFGVRRAKRYNISGSVGWFDSRIDDWIIWLPTVKGFYSPRNVKSVHAYGIAVEAAVDIQLAKDWHLSAKGLYSWTPSINCGEPYSAADRSVGKQLPYVPEHTANATVRLSFRRWSLLYKWCYYSERYTMSSNEHTLTGTLPDYYMSNLSLEHRLSFSWADLSLKGSINNLFDEEYVSVLSRPMPGINFEIFVGITPKW